MVGMILTSNAIFVTFSILAFIMKNEIQLPVPVLFPFTDLGTIGGLTINMANQLSLCFIGLTGNIGIEIPTCMLINSVWITTVTICHAIDEITERLNEPARNTKIAIDYCFRNILIQVQDLDRFV